ncbi:unnamed protein product [Leptidea sinapis]|uniref:Uncharacterized protein n=1 Tax=Leptidea sinapis TaxID=189913 RepID=A0A5E4PLZ8_9NEOP|nr:unnamed protein product [Leptidea sinapis]
MMNSITDSFAAYTSIIIRPWSRVAPYFLGLLTGWLVHRIDGYLAISKLLQQTSSVGLWISSASILVVSSVVPWLDAGWMAAWLHLSWPMALIWPVVWFYFAGATLLTLASALLLALLVEMPACSFLRRLSDLAYR